MCEKATIKTNQKFRKQLREMRLHNISNVMLSNIIKYTKFIVFNKQLDIVPTCIERGDNNIKLSYIETNGDRLDITVKSYSDDNDDYCFDYAQTIDNRSKNIMNTNWTQVSRLINKWSTSH